MGAIMGWLIAILIVGCVAAAMKSSSAARHNRADRAPRELRQKLDENGQPLYNQWGGPVLEDDLNCCGASPVVYGQVSRWLLWPVLVLDVLFQRFQCGSAAACRVVAGRP